MGRLGRMAGVPLDKGHLGALNAGEAGGPFKRPVYMGTDHHQFKAVASKRFQSLGSLYREADRVVGVQMWLPQAGRARCSPRPDDPGWAVQAQFARVSIAWDLE